MPTLLHFARRGPTRWALPLVALSLATTAWLAAEEAGLSPTVHAPLPAALGNYFLVPTPGGAPVVPAAKLALGIRLIDQRNYTAALTQLRDEVLASSPLAGHAAFHSARALRGLDRLDDADAALIALTAQRPAGYLEEAVPSLRAEIATQRGDARTALAVLESMSTSRTTAPHALFLRLGLAAERAGEVDKAVRAYRRVYFEFPVSDEAEAAKAALTRLQAGPSETPEVMPLELARAEALFGARRWNDARASFQMIARLAAAEDARALATLRMAECDVQLGRGRQALAALAPFVEDGPRQVEAQYYGLLATKAVSGDAAYEQAAKAFVQDHPTSVWTEDVLNALATSYIVRDDDAAADSAFRDLLALFPKGRYAERAAWKVGWAAYRAGRFDEAARVFDTGSANAPRADYRPSWLYWAGRAYEQSEQAALATARYRLTATDYLNSYYGRLATRQLERRREGFVAPRVVAEADTLPSPLIPTDVVVRLLVGGGAYDEATRELEYAARVWGGSPAIEATTAWMRNRRAADLTATERFQHLRGAINQMKRAYPQYLAAGGEALPADVLKIIFPLDYWPLIRAQAEERKLDPYLMAALVAQESTFTADIRSAANAVGLMQLIPSTGRRYATKLGVRGYTSTSLTRPEINVRLGMTYFKDLLAQFGGAHLALASYNAGEHRVARWVAERQGLSQDEFIDDIPFPETQGYVKRILGTAEDYRRLYGGNERAALQVSAEAYPVAR